MKLKYILPAALFILTIIKVSGQCPLITAYSVTECSPGTYTLTATSYGSSVTGHKWYTVPSPGTTYVTADFSYNPYSSIGTSTYTFTVAPGTAAFTKDYYITAVCGGSEGTRKQITFTYAPFSGSIVFSPYNLNFCIGSSITFTANANLSVSSYQWQMNGSNVAGATSSTFTTTVSSVAQLQSVKVTMTTNACSSNNSQTISMSDVPFVVNSIVTPSVSISSNVGNSICGGTATTFTASPTNGGSPTYQWLVDGSAAPGATNSPTYTTSALTNGQVVTCSMTSDLSCASPSVANSNAITMAVTSYSLIDVTISGVTTICQGSDIRLNALISGGNNLSYSWKKNGTTVTSSVVGPPPQLLIFNPVNDGDVFTCTVSSDGCYIPGVSNSLTIKVLPETALTANITFTPFAQTFCAGSDITFAASSNLPAASYQWQENGSDIPGEIRSTYLAKAVSTVQLNSIQVKVTSNEQCIVNSFATAVIQTPPFIVNPQPTIPSVQQPYYIANNTAATLSASGAASGQGYKWYTTETGGTALGSATTSNLTATTTYYVTKYYTATGCESSPRVPFVVTVPPNNYNYIRNTAILVSGKTDASQLASLVTGEKNVSTAYFDGLGRDYQTVTMEGSPNKKDIVLPHAYNEFSQEALKFLPYVSTENNGWFKLNPTDNAGSYIGSLHQLFYQNGTNDKVQDDTRPYAEIVFESSPLDRVLKQGAPGTAWQPDNSSYDNPSDHSVKHAYEFNTANEVLNFVSVAPDATYTMGSVALSKKAIYYAANQLYKSRTKDEEGNEVIEFKDKEGKVILKKVRTDATTYAQTQYIYDDLGKLVCVLQPEAMANVTSKLPITWASLTTTVELSGNLLRKKTTASSGYSANGSATSTVSTETLAAGMDGAVEATANETNTSRMIGFAPSNVTGTAISYAMEFNKDGTINVWESGSIVTNLGSYVTGTIIRISREGGIIKYYVNGVLKYTSATASNTSLIVDTAFDDAGGTLQDVTLSYKVDVYMPTALTTYAFLYTYDNKERMSQKQVPGADPVYMVYDNRDRLVLTQAGNQRKTPAGAVSLTDWLFTKYDYLNRPVLTGIYTADVVLSQSDMQARVDDYYNNLTTNSGAWFETYVGSASGNIHGYGNKSYPVLTAEEECLTVSYYDSYDFKSLFGTSVFDFNNSDLPADTQKNYPGQATAVLPAVNGQVLGTKVKSLSAYSWHRTVNYFDDRYRLVQQVAENQKGLQVTTNVYDFVGKIIRTKSSLYLGQPASWTNVVNVQTQGDHLVSTGGGSWGSGATSSQVLAANADGWEEITVDTRIPRYMVGLADEYGTTSYTYIDFAFYVNGNTLTVRESGTQKWSGGTVLPGDVLRVERVNGKIYYKKNGIPLYISTVPSTSSLFLYVSFSGSGARLSKARLSNTFSVTNPPLIADSYFIKRFTYDHAGRLVDTWHQVKDGSAEILLSKNIYNELGQLVDKKLHSTVATASDARQSVDYRYNIRGWLTSINNSTLTSDDTNDDTGDFFGMDLLYDQDNASLASTGLYNGNISGMKWSTALGLGDVKETGYNFNYDALNRLKEANSRMNKNNLWQAGYFDEKVTGYDLNGNILNLQRKGDGGVDIDNLTYNYGTTKSNKLLSVTDGVSNATDKVKGFADGNTTGNDYSYDWNGNMSIDKNKGITTAISYNHLNLPVTLTRSFASLLYQYDATGLKLAQVATFDNTQKRTEYVGPWIFENNVLQFIQHDEGRIMLTDKKTIYTYSFDDASVATATANATLTPTTINGEKYVKVALADGTLIARSGVTAVGPSFPVTEGEHYVLRVKGYSNNGSQASLYVANASDNTDVFWSGATLLMSAANESWVESSFVIQPGITEINVGVLYSTGNTATSATSFYLNEMELYKIIDNAAPEYQYNIKDHLGNIRVTFTTKDDIDCATGTYEDANAATERSKFLRYDNARIVNHYLFDHTNGSAPTTVNGGAQRLNGQGNELYGLARSLSVMPGDVIDMEVYAKYIDPSSSNRTVDLNTLISQIAAGTTPAGTVVDGSSYGSSTSDFPFPIGLNGTATSTGTGPKAYLNWLVYDRNYNLIAGKCGYARMTTAALETGQDVAHEKLTGTITIGEAGYVYIYLSNEEGMNPYECYFDDFKVCQTKSPVIQVQDYYPFGLAFNSYSRENSIPQDYKYNGKEEQTELDLGWLDYGARMYMSDIGRWGVQDPLAELMIAESPYVYVSNNPLLINDPTGMMGENVNHHIASTFVDPNGKVIEHRDDGDNNVYLVNDPANWNGSKNGLSILGEEDPSKSYKVGDQYTYYHSSSQGYDPASLLNYLGNITTTSMAMVAGGKASAMLDNMAVNFVPIWDETGKQVIGFMPKGKGSFAYTAIRYTKGALEFLGPAGDVLFTLYNIKQFSDGTMSGGKLAYNVVSTGAGFYAGFAYGGPVGVAVGTVFFIGEAAYDSIQNLKAMQDRNRTPENTITNWGQLLRKLTAFSKWDFGATRRR